SLPPFRAPPQHTWSMKPNATLRVPSFRRKAPRRNNFAALPRPDTVSSLASDFSVDPRKLFSPARYQAADVGLLQRQCVGNLAVRKPLLFEQQAAPHRLLYFVLSPSS